MNIDTIILSGIVTIGVIILSVYRINKLTLSKRLKKVCTMPIIAVIANMEEMVEPIPDEIADIFEDSQEFKGKSLVFGFPEFEYDFNEHSYKEKYYIKPMSLLSDDELLIDGDKVEILVNPNKPTEIYIDKPIDKFAMIDW